LLRLIFQPEFKREALMSGSFTRHAALAVIVAGNFIMTTGAVATPRPLAELKLQRQEAQPKLIPEQPPLFGEYLGSGDGRGSGALAGRIKWDLYETHTPTRHPAWFRGTLERDGRQYPFEIIGVYTPDPSDSARWRISGVIAFDDTRLLGRLHAPLTGTFEANTNSARYTVWVDGKSR
jgi:hypothetical protein